MEAPAKPDRPKTRQHKPIVIDKRLTELGNGCCENLVEVSALGFEPGPGAVLVGWTETRTPPPEIESDGMFLHFVWAYSAAPASPRALPLARLQQTPWENNLDSLLDHPAFTTTLEFIFPLLGCIRAGLGFTRIVSVRSGQTQQTLVYMD